MERPGFTLYVNGYAVSDAYFVGSEAPTEFTPRQVVKLTAESPEEARRRIIEAMGREPDGLTVTPGR